MSQTTHGYVVIGHAGQYEDYEAWPVAAFTSQARADTWARKIGEHTGPDGSPYDPQATFAAGPPTYTVCEVPLNPPDPTAAEIQATR